jgi:predicted dehydrogenase
LANAEFARDSLGYDYATDDYKELLSDNRIDVVNICTPNNLHYEMLTGAIAAGKHIYCDKPLVIDEKEAEAVANAAANAGLVCQVAFNNRFLPATLRARQLIEEGRLGRILSFRAAYLHSGSVDPNKPIGWKQDQDQAGGVLFDLGSHVIDLIYHLLGEYKRVMSHNVIAYPYRPTREGDMKKILAEDASIIIAELANGATGVIEASKIATGSSDELRFEINGDKGAIKFNLMDPNWLEFYDNTLPEAALGGERGFKKIECVQRFEKPGGAFPAPKSSIGWIRSHAHSLYSFIDCVNRNVPASPSFAEGAYVQKIMAMAIRSSNSGSWQSCI